MATTHLLADVNGWWAGGSSFSGVVPDRVFDTRTGSGWGSRSQGVGRAGAPGEGHGRSRVPASGVAAVSLNVTATEPDSAGYATVYGCGARPTASNLNFVARQTVPNAVITPVAPDGTICVYTMATTHLIADVNGWWR